MDLAERAIKAPCPRGGAMSEGDARGGMALGVSLNVLLLGLVSFITDVSSEMIHPVLPSFIEALGATALAVGLVGGVGDLMQNVLKAPSGYLSDRTGRRKALTGAGYAISAVSKLFIPFSASWAQVMALRAIERTGKGVRTAPRDALIAESGGKRGRAFGIHRALDTLGAVVGSTTAFLLLLVAKLPLKDIMLYGALVAFGALIPLIFVKETARKRRARDTGGGRAKTAVPSALKKFLAVATLFGLSNMTYMLFILYALTFVEPPLGLDPVVFATGLYVLFNVFYAGLSVPSGSLSDRIGRKKVIALGYAIFTLVCLGLMAELSSPLVPIVVSLFCLYGASTALIDGTQRAYASDLAPREARGYALGIFHTSIGLASLASGLIAGAIWDFLSAWWAFAYAAILSAISAVLILALCE